MSENKIPLRKEQIGLIEELAHVHETAGLQPAMAKIMSLLTVSDEVELTFNQIKDTLDLSKSAVSQALNQLLITKKLNYKSKLGDRKRYFYVRISDWEGQILELFSGIAPMIEVYKKVLANRSNKTPEFNYNLKNMNEFLSFLHDQVPLLYTKYKQGR